jgi:hypothetical protein
VTTLFFLTIRLFNVLSRTGSITGKVISTAERVKTEAGNLPKVPVYERPSTSRDARKGSQTILACH